MATEFLRLLVLHLGRLYLYLFKFRVQVVAGVGQDQLGLLQGPSYVQTMEVVQNVVCDFAAHLDYTLQAAFIFMSKRPTHKGQVQ